MTLKTLSLWAVIVASLVGAITGGLHIYTWEHRSRPHIDAIVSYGPIVETPALDQMWAAVGQVRSGSWAAGATKAALAKESEHHRTAALDTPQGRAAQRDVLAAAIQSLRRVLPVPMLAREAAPRFYERIVVENSGSKEANGVQLSVPGAEALMVDMSGAHTYQYLPVTKWRLVSGSRVTLGTMEPLVRVVVTALMNDPVVSFDADRVRVVYSNGVGHVSSAATIKFRIFSPLTLVLFLLIGSVLVAALFSLVGMQIVSARGWTLYLVRKGQKAGAPEGGQTR